MKKLSVVLCFLGIVLVSATAGWAVPVTPQQLTAGGYVVPDGFQTVATKGMTALDHYEYYQWYLNDVSTVGGPLTQVDIVFHGINDWIFEQDVLKLYVKDYDGAKSGWKVGTDLQMVTYPEWTTSMGYTSIGTWSYPDTRPVKYDVVFSITDQAILDILSDGSKFILGIDPDCHYYVNKIGIYAGFGAASVPEPATMLLLGAGLLGLAGLSRKRMLKP